MSVHKTEIERHHEMWERQIVDDLESGRIDVVLEQVEREYQAGLATPLLSRRCETNQPRATPWVRREQK
jgi:hypothetical protein